MTTVMWDTHVERLCLSSPGYGSLGSTRWPHRRPTEGGSLTGRWTHCWQQGCECPCRKALTKDTSHTWSGLWHWGHRRAARL